jgi:hypothetical protein
LVSMFSLFCQFLIYYTNRSVYNILTERREMSMIIYGGTALATTIIYYYPDIIVL